MPELSSWNTYAGWINRQNVLHGHNGPIAVLDALQNVTGLFFPSEPNRAQYLKHQHHSMSISKPACW